MFPGVLAPSVFWCHWMRHRQIHDFMAVLATRYVKHESYAGCASRVKFIAFYLPGR